MTTWNDIEAAADDNALARNLRKQRQDVAKPKRKKNTPEADTQRAILDYLAMRPDVYAMRVNSGKFQMAHGGWFQAAPTGTSDIIGWWQREGFAVFLAIEVKAGNGKASIPQLEFISRVNAAGGCAFVARSVDDVIEKLK